MYRYHLTKLYIYFKMKKDKSNQVDIQYSWQLSPAGEGDCAAHHLGTMMENCL